jgi:hypothetical protein
LEAFLLLPEELVSFFNGDGSKPHPISRLELSDLA